MQSFFILFCTALVWVQPAVAQKAGSTSNDRADGADQAVDAKAIMAQSRRLSEAYVRGDIEELVSMYAADGVAAPAGRDFVRGHESLLPLWALPEGRTVLRHSATSVELTIDGGHAYDWGYYEGQAAQNGEPLDPFRGTYVIVWERGDDGIWRIAVDMWAGLRHP